MEDSFSTIFYILAFVGFIIFNTMKAYHKAKNQETTKPDTDFPEEHTYTYNGVDEQTHFDYENKIIETQPILKNTKKKEDLKEANTNKINAHSHIQNTVDKKNKRINLRKAIIFSEILNRPYN